MRTTSQQARFETLRFDGRDLTDDATHRNDVCAYQLRTCHYCGTVRDERFPFCCGFSTEAQRVPLLPQPWGADRRPAPSDQPHP